MDLPELIHRLASPSAYPFRVDRTEVRQTHISVVFLANDVVYKLKKPLNLGFLDFSTIDKRRHFCEEEVRLNRRLAPDVYLGVVPITTGDSLQFEGTGSIVDWAVKMTRLPDSQTLESLLRQQRLSTEMLQTFARRLAEFHRNAERSKAISAFGQLEVVARNAIENFEQTASHVDVTVQRSVYDRLQWLTQYSLTQLGLLIENRSHRGVPCDTHGDLRLDHVYYFADRKPPSDWIVIDCIEFNKRFRYADPVADVAFLAMDLVFRHRRDLARAFANEWFDASYDDEGRSLLPFYMAYRSIVRAKVEGFKLTEPEIPELQRETAKRRSQSHWPSKDQRCCWSEACPARGNPRWPLIWLHGVSLAFVLMSFARNWPAFGLGNNRRRRRVKAFTHNTGPIELTANALTVRGSCSSKVGELSLTPRFTTTGGACHFLILPNSSRYHFCS
jgi:aminoglycoside phosphotransferase family enzyme